MLPGLSSYRFFDYYKIAHPDVGGSRERFDQVQEAYRQALESRR